jgi:transcriptional regulator with XRE-family HTH domain
MRLSTHLKAARTTRGLTPAATGALTGIGATRLEMLESGERLPSANELTSLATIYTIDSPTMFVWYCHELAERVVEADGQTMIRFDEDLFELLDQMVCFLANRGRL